MFDADFRRRLLAMLAALFAAACGGGGGTSAPAPAFDGDPSQVLTITIRNEQIDVARISLWINSARRRLGDVRGNATETFHVPMRNSASVRMTFDLTLGASCVTRDVVLRPGEVIEATIPVNLSTMAAVCQGRR